MHGEGRTHYALVGPTPRTGNEIVCAAAVLIPWDPGTHGGAANFKLTRTCVLEMKRGPNYLFVYAVMTSIDDTYSEGVVETFT